MQATATDHNTALDLAGALRAKFPGLDEAVQRGVTVGSVEHAADSVLIDLSRVCLSHTAGISGPTAERVFSRAQQMLADAGAEAPVFEVLEQTAAGAHVRTASGRLYGLTREGATWRRGYRVAATMADAMRGAE